MEPARFDEMRRGCWDPIARVADMDLDGVWASLCYPSLIAGFAGSMFSQTQDVELGLACMRAWNDWHLDAWVGSDPGALHPRTAAVAARARARGRRDPSQRRTWLQGGDVSREPCRSRPAVDAHRPLGPVPRGVRRDRHGRLPALRVVGMVRVAIAGRTARVAHLVVPRQRVGHRGRLVVVGRAGAIPIATDLSG